MTFWWFLCWTLLLEANSLSLLAVWGAEDLVLKRTCVYVAELRTTTILLSNTLRKVYEVSNIFRFQYHIILAKYGCSKSATPLCFVIRIYDTPYSQPPAPSKPTASP